MKNRKSKVGNRGAPRRVAGRRSNRKSQIANRKSKIPAKQGKGPKRVDVGYGKPPAEHRFSPGQSGNPAGPPPARTQLYRYLSGFVGMLEPQVKAIQQDPKEPLGRRTAARIALQHWKKGIIGVGLPFTIYLINREEGRPTTHVVVEAADVLTPEECEEIRRIQRGLMEKA